MRSSHDTANPRLVEVLTSEGPSAIHWLEELGVEFTRQGLCWLRPSLGARLVARVARRGTACSRS